MKMRTTKKRPSDPGHKVCHGIANKVVQLQSRRVLSLYVFPIIHVPVLVLYHTLPYSALRYLALR